MSILISPDGLELIVSGVMLFLIGMLQGVAIEKFKNSRMALSAHLTAAQSGMALMIFGVIWSVIDLVGLTGELAKIALILCLYLIWFGITVSAITGASKALPIAGEGYAGSKVSETLVSVLTAIGGLLLIVSCIAILIGLAQSL
ncbi:MAG: hydrogenase [Pseudomonadota bacterium]